MRALPPLRRSHRPGGPSSGVRRLRRHLRSPPLPSPRHVQNCNAARQHNPTRSFTGHTHCTTWFRCWKCTTRRTRTGWLGPTPAPASNARPPATTRGRQMRRTASRRGKTRRGAKKFANPEGKPSAGRAARAARPPPGGCPAAALLRRLGRPRRRAAVEAPRAAPSGHQRKACELARPLPGVSPLREARADGVLLLPARDEGARGSIRREERVATSGRELLAHGGTHGRPRLRAAPGVAQRALQAAPGGDARVARPALLQVVYRHLRRVAVLRRAARQGRIAGRRDG